MSFYNFCLSLALAQSLSSGSEGTYLLQKITSTNVLPFPRSSLRPWFGVRSRNRRQQRLRFAFRVSCVALALVLVVLHLSAERMTFLTLTGPGLSPSQRYAQLLVVTRLWPFDRNIRWEPEMYRQMVNAGVGR